MDARFSIGGNYIQSNYTDAKLYTVRAFQILKPGEHLVKGNINSAWELLTNNMENGIAPLNKDSLPILIQKHPKGRRAPQDILFNGAI